MYCYIVSFLDVNSYFFPLICIISINFRRFNKDWRHEIKENERNLRQTQRGAYRFVKKGYFNSVNSVKVSKSLYIGVTTQFLSISVFHFYEYVYYMFKIICSKIIQYMY